MKLYTINKALRRLGVVLVVQTGGEWVTLHLDLARKHPVWPGRGVS
jgi:hypothetical protein